MVEECCTFSSTLFNVLTQLFCYSDDNTLVGFLAHSRPSHSVSFPRCYIDEEFVDWEHVSHQWIHLPVWPYTKTQPLNPCSHFSMSGEIRLSYRNSWPSVGGKTKSLWMDETELIIQVKPKSAFTLDRGLWDILWKIFFFSVCGSASDDQMSIDACFWIRSVHHYTRLVVRFTFLDVLLAAITAAVPSRQISHSDCYFDIGRHFWFAIG